MHILETCLWKLKSLSKIIVRSYVVISKLVYAVGSVEVVIPKRAYNIYKYLLICKYSVTSLLPSLTELGKGGLNTRVTDQILLKLTDILFFSLWEIICDWPRVDSMERCNRTS